MRVAQNKLKLFVKNMSYIFASNILSTIISAYYVARTGGIFFEKSIYFCC